MFTKVSDSVFLPSQFNDDDDDDEGNSPDFDDVAAEECEEPSGSISQGPLQNPDLPV